MGIVAWRVRYNLSYQDVNIVITHVVLQAGLCHKCDKSVVGTCRGV